MCRCSPILLCAVCGVAKAYHDDKKNVMTNDHDWTERKMEKRCACCGRYDHEEKDCNTARALSAAISYGVDPAY